MSLATSPDYWKFFAGEAKRGRSPLYETLSTAIADDAEIQEVAGQVRTGQPPANMLYGAVHQRLLGGDAHALRAYYPSCGGTRAVDADTFATFRAFVFARRADLEAVIAARVTNTNEVARSGLLYPAYDWIAARTAAPLQILEIGPSAGFNLNWHRYGYRYTDNHGTIERNAASSLVLDLGSTGRPLELAPGLPAVAKAVGLERNPVDISRPEERQWQRALVWPERLDRLRRLDGAIAIAVDHPPEILQGDAVSGLAALAERFDPGLPLVLIHSFVTYQFDTEARAALDSEIAKIGRRRLLYRVSVEWAKGLFPLEVTEFRSGEGTRLVLAHCDSHGGSIEWIGA